jgi:hypothetical protein
LSVKVSKVGLLKPREREREGGYCTVEARGNREVHRSGGGAEYLNYSAFPAFR